MPVTQRWVHSGLILVAGILSLSLTVLILGASRPAVSTAGLEGSAAPAFSLRDTAGGWVKLKEYRPSIVVLLAVPQRYDLSQQAVQVQRLIETFSKNSDVQFVGLQFDAETGILASTRTRPGAIETSLPSLRAAHDVDGSVALAYRVSKTPVLFVIDADGVIRARLPMDVEGSMVAASETIMSLRHAEQTMPTTPSDHRLF